MQYTEFIPILLMLLAGIINIVVGVKIVQVTRNEGKTLPWYKQINIALGAIFLSGSLFVLLIGINEVTHNGVGDVVLLGAMIVLGILFLGSLVLLYQAGKYLRQQRNQPQVK